MSFETVPASNRWYPTVVRDTLVEPGHVHHERRIRWPAGGEWSKCAASRPLSEILDAVNLYSAAGLETTDDLAFGPPFPAVNCGEVERVN